MNSILSRVGILRLPNLSSSGIRLSIDIHNVAIGHTLPVRNHHRSMSTVASKIRQSVKEEARSSISGTPIHYVTLNNISDNPGAVKKKRRIGRGIGSSKGKTSGRGHKGQKARSGGKAPAGFEGGQTKLYKRIPKRGFKNAVHGQEMLPVNVGTLQDWVDMGRLRLPGSDGDNDKDSAGDAASPAPITMADLVDCGMLKASRILGAHGVKLLGHGKERVRSPIRIEVSRASESAIAAIESVEGGEVVTVHYNRLALRALLKPDKFAVLPRQALPPPKLQTYYTSYEKRGYLSPEIQRRKVLRRLQDTKDSGQVSSGVPIDSHVETNQVDTFDEVPSDDNDMSKKD